ncbi:IS21 family transposase [Candidatus Bipolaricaulota bacterium]|nr:IS21 family transposase [Candidatus Bipolaricaulota bacterium]
MGTFLSVRALHDEGVPNKEVARRLGIDVRTVRAYLRKIEGGMTEPARAVVARKLDRFAEVIEAKVLQGLTAVQIYQDLCREDGFDASYPTVQRRVRTLRRGAPEVYCRMRYTPGEEAQIDFGELGRLAENGRKRKVYLFVMTLCWSRYAYYDLVTDQRVETFLRLIRSAFEFFGGAPQRIKPDNLRSAVIIDRLGQRYYQEEFFRLAQHYGTVPDVARPRTPTDKGRTERDIGYAKGNWWRGRGHGIFPEAREDLVRWRDEVANVRVHGTTRRRPCALFAEERAHLVSLPEERYELGDWGLYKVRKDCHIHVRRNYYSVPYRWVGMTVLVRLTDDELTVFADGSEVARHPRATRDGEDVTDPTHYPATKGVSNHEVHGRRLAVVRGAGGHSARFLRELQRGPWVFGEQLARLHRLVERHGAEAFERACARALYFGATDGARRIERILEGGLDKLPLPGERDRRVPDGRRDFGRSLREYAALLENVEVAA